MGFERVDFVTAPGEFAVRGGIIDVFSFAYQHPYRIEFFDETVERLSSFDVVTQRSITAFEEIELLPNTSDHDFTDKRKTLLSFFSENSCFVFADLDKTTHSLGQLYEKAENTFRNFDTTTQYPPETLFVHPEEWIEDCQNKSILVLEKTEQLKIKEQLFIKQSPQPPFHKKFDLLVAHLNENKERGYHNTLFCSNEQQAKRFHDIFEEMEEKVHYQTKVLPIYEGFEDLEAQWACFSDHQIFERYHKYQLKSDRRKKKH